MRCIQSFLPSNLAGYKSNNSCSASTQYDAQRAACGVLPDSELYQRNPLPMLKRRYLEAKLHHSVEVRFICNGSTAGARSGKSKRPRLSRTETLLYQNRTVLTISARGTV